MELNERIKALREETGLTQKQFALELRLNQSKYNKWETGASSPNYTELPILAEKFSVTTDYLLGRTTSRTHEHTDICDKYGIAENVAEKLMSLQNNCEDDESATKMLTTLNAILSDENFLTFVTEFLFSQLRGKEMYAFCKIYAGTKDTDWDNLPSNTIEEWKFKPDVWEVVQFQNLQRILSDIRATLFQDEEE